MEAVDAAAGVVTGVGLSKGVADADFDVNVAPPIGGNGLPREEPGWDTVRALAETPTEEDFAGAFSSCTSVRLKSSSNFNVPFVILTEMSISNAVESMRLPHVDTN
jgi:hypothetical protein